MADYNRTPIQVRDEVRVLLKIQGLVNELEHDNVVAIADELVQERSFATVDRMTATVALIMDKALDERWTAACARICRQLGHEEAEDISGEPVRFCNVLLRHAQFYLEETEAEYLGLEQKVRCDGESETLQERCGRAKRRYMDNIRLATELYKMDQLTDGMIISCFEKLLPKSETFEDVDEVKVECLCTLLQSCATKFREPNTLDVFLQQLYKLDGAGLMSSPIRLVMKDTIECLFLRSITLKKRSVAKPQSAKWNDEQEQQRAMADVEPILLPPQHQVSTRFGIAKGSGRLMPEDGHGLSKLSSVPNTLFFRGTGGRPSMVQATEPGRRSGDEDGRSSPEKGARMELITLARPVASPLPDLSARPGMRFTDPPSSAEFSRAASPPAVPSNVFPQLASPFAPQDEAMLVDAMDGLRYGAQTPDTGRKNVTENGMKEDASQRYHPVSDPSAVRSTYGRDVLLELERRGRNTFSQEVAQRLTDIIKSTPVGGSFPPDYSRPRSRGGGRRGGHRSNVLASSEFYRVASPPAVPSSDTPHPLSRLFAPQNDGPNVEKKSFQNGGQTQSALAEKGAEEDQLRRHSVNEPPAVRRTYSRDVLLQLEQCGRNTYAQEVTLRLADIIKSGTPGGGHCREPEPKNQPMLVQLGAYQQVLSGMRPQGAEASAAHYSQQTGSGPQASSHTVPNASGLMPTAASSLTGGVPQPYNNDRLLTKSDYAAQFGGVSQPQLSAGQNPQKKNDPAFSRGAAVSHRLDS